MSRSIKTTDKWRKCHRFTYYNAGGDWHSCQYCCHGILTLLQAKHAPSVLVQPLAEAAKTAQERLKEHDDNKEPKISDPVCTSPVSSPIKHTWCVQKLAGNMDATLRNPPDLNDPLPVFTYQSPKHPPPLPSRSPVWLEDLQNWEGDFNVVADAE